MTLDAIHSLLRVLHIAGGVLAFAVAPLVLLAVKGSRRHIVAGRCFVLGMGSAAIAGIVLTLALPQHDVGLLLLGFTALFFTATGYLAPRIGRGSLPSYRWDRALTALGLLASLGLAVDGLHDSTLAAPVTADAMLGALGAWVAIRHSLWRGPADASRWRVEHFTALLAAYSVAWVFVLAQFVQALPQAAHVAVPILGFAGILWARRRFRVIAPAAT
jgi:uncharacterized membrane protein